MSVQNEKASLASKIIDDIIVRVEDLEFDKMALYGDPLRIPPRYQDMLLRSLQRMEADLTMVECILASRDDKYNTHLLRVQSQRLARKVAEQ